MEDGLKVLYQIAYEYFNKQNDKIYVVAPMSHQSCASTKLSFTKQIGYKQYKFQLADGKYLDGYIVDGSPCDCSRFGIDKYKPDLVLSGINRGSNIGMDTYYSGTLGVCRDATFQHIPNIAFSNAGVNQDYYQMYSKTKYTFSQIFEKFNINLLQQIANQNMVLNINFPRGEIQGLCQAKLVPQTVYNFIVYNNNENDTYSYGLKSSLNKYSVDQDTDYYLLHNGYATYTIIQMNQTVDISYFDVKQEKDIQ